MDILQQGIFLTLLISTIRLATPGMIGAMGGLVSELSGTMNLCAEGLLTFGAFFAVLATYYTGNPWVGVLCGIAAGIVGGALNMLVTVEFGGNQMLFGLGFNTFATGITAFFCRVVWGAGRSETVADLWSTDFLHGIPVIGPTLASFSPLTYIAILLAILVWLMLYKTTLGLRIRAVGNDPRALETAGINVWALKGFAVVLCGAIMGFAGAFLSVGQLSLYVDNLVASKGMIAFVTVKMGNYRPRNIIFFAILFAFFDALQMQLQMLNIPFMPTELIVAIPYIAALIILFFQNETETPKAMGVPFLRRKLNFSIEDDDV